MLDLKNKREKYLEPFIQANKDVLDYVHVMKLADDQFVVHIAFDVERKNGKLLDQSVFFEDWDWETDYLPLPNTGEVEQALQEMERRGILEVA
ncbi:MAG: hypothetical protein FWG68_02945 [Defluviitaleaceae bacterium]|nr:hypothetical protein [Defluviitaleaceae bacterium]